MANPKQVAILVDEIELMNLTMGLCRLEDHWMGICSDAIRRRDDSGSIVTYHQVINAITDLKDKLKTIKQEQF